jgi:hypothetical protein
MNTVPTLIFSPNTVQKDDTHPVPQQAESSDLFDPLSHIILYPTRGKRSPLFPHVTVGQNGYLI